MSGKQPPWDSSGVSGSARTFGAVVGGVAAILGTIKTLGEAVGGDLSLGDITYWIGVAGFGLYCGGLPTFALASESVDEREAFVAAGVVGLAVAAWFIFGSGMEDPSDVNAIGRTFFRLIGLIVLGIAVAAATLRTSDH